MGKDFRIGLMAGTVLAVSGLLWVATRPGLRPQARLPRSSQAGARDPGFSIGFGPPSGSGPNESLNRGVADGSNRVSSAATGQLDAAPGEARSPAGQEITGVEQPQGPALANPQPAAPGPPLSAWPDQTIYEKTEKIKTTRFHIVRRGESLSGIARQYYGSPNRWRKILAANQKIIADPDRIAPGTKLIIPD